MIERALKPKLLTLSEQYPIVTLTGPRQSGKSTLLKNTFPNYQYVSQKSAQEAHQLIDGRNARH